MSDQIKKSEVSATEEEVKLSTLNHEMEEAKMTTPENNGHDAAVQTTSLDTADTTDMSDTSTQDAEEETALGVIDHVKKQEIEEKFQELINNPKYWGNPNRIKRLEEALVLPVFDDRSKQQFYISAKDELLAKEIKAAITQSRIPVMPTEDQIKELAEKKHSEKLKQDAERAAKAKKVADKAAAKSS